MSDFSIVQDVGIFVIQQLFSINPYIAEAVAILLVLVLLYLKLKDEADKGRKQKELGFEHTFQKTSQEQKVVRNVQDGIDEFLNGK